MRLDALKGIGDPGRMTGCCTARVFAPNMLGGERVIMGPAMEQIRGLNVSTTDVKVGNEIREKGLLRSAALQRYGTRSDSLIS